MDVIEVFGSFTKLTDFNISVHDVSRSVEVVELVKIKIIVVFELWQFLAFSNPVP